MDRKLAPMEQQMKKLEPVTEQLTNLNTRFSVITRFTPASPVFPLRSRPKLMRMALTLQISKFKSLRFASNVISYFWTFRVLPPVW